MFFAALRHDFNKNTIFHHLHNTILHWNPCEQWIDFHISLSHVKKKVGGREFLSAIDNEHLLRLKMKAEGSNVGRWRIAINVFWMIVRFYSRLMGVVCKLCYGFVKRVLWIIDSCLRHKSWVLRTSIESLLIFKSFLFKIYIFLLLCNIKQISNDSLSKVIKFIYV